MAIKEVKPEDLGKRASKITMFGNAGSGKSETGIITAIGLAKNHSPRKKGMIAIYDTEGRDEDKIPLIFEAGLKVSADNSTSFAGLLETLSWAERNADVLVVDGIEKAWADLVESYRKKWNIHESRKIPMHMWEPIKGRWKKEWVSRFLNSPIHIIVLAREANTYETYEEEDEVTGKKKINFRETGVRAAGEKTFGYEAPFVVIMKRDTPDSLTRSYSGVDGLERMKQYSNSVNFCVIDKDDHVLSRMQGKVIVYPRYEDFLPHLKHFGGYTGYEIDHSDSTHLIPHADKEDYSKRRKIVQEKWDNIVEQSFPGTKQEDKRMKAALLSKFFDTGSEIEAFEKKDIAFIEKRVSIAASIIPAAKVLIDEGGKPDITAMIKEAEAISE